MAKISVTFEGFPLTQQDFQRLPGKMDHVVARLPTEISSFLMRGFSPKNEAQPPNSPYTVWLKGHNIPGVDTGLLSAASNWDVSRRMMGWEISPPPIRQPVIERLEPLGFNFVDFPQGWEDMFAEEALRQLIDVEDKR